jgi:predicted AAA+ superfamily ATPase
MEPRNNVALFSRTVLEEIRPFLKTRDIVVLHGARQVGKTSLLHIIEREYRDQKMPTLMIDLEDSRFVALLDGGVDEFLAYLSEQGIAGNRTEHAVICIDEIQYLKNPSSFLKLIADHHPNLKLIVSGSSSFNIKKKFRTTLVGRTVNFEVWPLSFAEVLQFTHAPVEFPIKDTLTDPTRELLIDAYRDYCLYGGYPKIVLTPERAMKEKYLQQIIDTYIRKDIRDIGNIRDVAKFNNLTEVLASQSGCLLNVKELANTCDLSAQTTEQYLFLLEETYIITRVRPWSKNKRAELFKTPKVFFNDAGLMQMLWLKSLQKEIIGSVFETSVCAELVKKYGRANIHYWRTKDGKEIDFILKKNSGVMPLEAKLHFAAFQKKPFEVFGQRYHPAKEMFTALRGSRSRSIDRYPWEL